MKSNLRQTGKITLCGVMACFILSLSAQDFQPNTNWPYLYNDFEEGTIYFASNQQTKAKLNIHLSGNVLHYVDDKGKIFESSDDGIIRVEIGKDAYMFGDHQMMQIIHNEKHIVLVKLMRGKIRSNDEADSGGGAYGASLGTSATQKKATWGGGVTTRDLFQMYKEKNDGSAISLETRYYYIIEGRLVEADKRSIEKYLPAEQKAEWAKFLKSEKIKWKKEESLVQILDFLAK